MSWRKMSDGEAEELFCLAFSTEEVLISSLNCLNFSPLTEDLGSAHYLPQFIAKFIYVYKFQVLEASATQLTELV